MENHGSWLKNLAADESLWTNENSDVFPSVLNAEYRYLRELAMQGQVYGVMLQIKDLYESFIKMPVIMALIIIENMIRNETDEERKKKGEELLRKAVESPLAMGSWDSLAAEIVRQNRREQLELPQDLTAVLEKTRRFLNQRISADYTNALQWRNETIGHGALRFEDNPAFQQEVENILILFKKYFAGNERYSVSRLYESLYFRSGKKALRAECLYTDETDEFVLTADQKEYRTEYFVIQNELKYFFFESYYRRRKISRYNTWFGGYEINQPNQYFGSLSENEEEAEHSAAKAVITRQEDAILECLNDTFSYIRPVKLLEELQERMDDLQKGIITIQMERGTGKSAFAARMNGLYQEEALIENAFSRSYHISHASIRGFRDFINTVNTSFRRSFDPRQDLSSSTEELKTLPFESEQPSKEMADYLNFYHELYGQDYTILLIDGIDELNQETEKILSFVPETEDLEEGVFVILLSRFEDEKTVKGESIRFIEFCREKADSLIEIRRDSESSIAMMKEYIRIHSALSGDEMDLIRKADCRFLYLRPYILLAGKFDPDTENETRFAESFLNYLLVQYGDTAKKKLIETAAVIAMFPGISLEEYRTHLNCPQLTYSFIGQLNDLMPLLTAARVSGHTEYEFADEAYREYVLDTYQSQVKQAADYFNMSMRTYLNEKAGSPEELLLQRIFYKNDNDLAQRCRFFIPAVLRLRELSERYGSLLIDSELFIHLAEVCADYLWRQEMYDRILVNDLLDSVNAILLDGLMEEGAEKKSVIYEVFDLLSKYLCEQQPYKSLLFRNEVQQHLSERESFVPVYEYALTHRVSPDHCYWIFKYGLEFTDLEQLFSIYNADEFADFLVNTKDERQTQQLLEAIRPWLKEGLQKRNGPKPEDYVQCLKKAADDLNNHDYAFDDDPDYHHHSEYDVYILLRYNPQLKEKNPDETQKFWQSYYDRLDFELNYHEKEFWRFTDRLHLLSENWKDVFLAGCGNDPDILAGWAERFYSCDGSLKFWQKYLPVDLIVEAIYEYRRTGQKEKELLCAENLVYRYEDRNYLVRIQKGQILTSLRNHGKDDIYFTDNAIALLRFCHENGFQDAENRLNRALDDTLSRIIPEEKLDFINAKFLLPQLVRYLRIQKEIGCTETVSTYVNTYRNRLSSMISAFLQDAGRESNFNDFSDALCVLAESWRQDLDWTEGLRQCEQLQKLIEKVNDRNDEIFHEILQNCKAIISEYISYFQARLSGMEYHVSYNCFSQIHTAGCSLAYSDGQDTNLLIDFTADYY